MQLTNDLEAGQIQTTADVAPSAHTLFCGNALSTVFTGPPLALLCLLALSFYVLSGNSPVQSALKPPNSNTLLFGTYK